MQWVTLSLTDLQTKSTSSSHYIEMWDLRQIIETTLFYPSQLSFESYPVGQIQYVYWLLILMFLLKLQLLSVPSLYHVSYTNKKENKILLLGGEIQPSTGVELPGEETMILLLLSRATFLAKLWHFPQVVERSIFSMQFLLAVLFPSTKSSW